MTRIGRRDEETKGATNVSLNEVLVAKARALNINVSRAGEAGLEMAVRRAQAERWQIENDAGFEAWNAYVERNGIPMSKYRKF